MKKCKVQIYVRKNCLQVKIAYVAYNNLLKKYFKIIKSIYGNFN